MKKRPDHGPFGVIWARDFRGLEAARRLGTQIFMILSEMEAA